MIPAPPIDSRTAIDIARQVRTLLQTYTPDWQGAVVSRDGQSAPGDFGDALVRIFARYAEIVIERLNRTPEKNLLAYLDLLGESLLPPEPARVPSQDDDRAPPPPAPSPTPQEAKPDKAADASSKRCKLDLSFAVVTFPCQD